MKTIEQQLQILGLSEGASQLFPLLTQNPHGLTVLHMSKLLNLPRTTLYGYVDELLARGVIKKGMKEESSLYYPETKENIIALFDEKIDELSHIQKNIPDIWDTEQDQTYKPKFYIYEGKEAYTSVFRDILATDAESIDWYWPIGSMFDLVDEYQLQDFHRRRIRKNIGLRVLWPQKKKISKKRFSELFYGDENHNLREVRLLPKEIDQNIGYGIYGNKVAFISSDKEQYASVIDSRELAQALKSQFEYIWKQSKKY